MKNETYSRVMQNREGAYEWTYDLNLYRNPTVLYTLLKLFGFIFLVVMFFVIGQDVGPGFWQRAGKIALVFAAVFAGFTVILLLSYGIYCRINRGKYCVVFHMDEKGIEHLQMPASFDRAKFLADITMGIGLAAKQPGVVGSGLLMKAKSSQYSDFASVKKIRVKKNRNVIYLDSPLSHNQVYVGNEDFDRVLDMIRLRCVNAK